MDWMTQVKAELNLAEAARKTGNEGKARVCARRAAGHIIGEYFHRREISPISPSAYARLQSLRALEDISPQVRDICDHFLMRITPNYTLPIEVDLIAEARWLVQELLGDFIE
jgi:hypothetical protein